MSRHENSNQFKDGLLMDLHPLQTPNTVLTDCLNGTFITYNGNEYSLQNDMGNFKLKNCRLSPGYLPIGSTSYADTIYLLSYNPIDDKIEVGSYPSPVQYNDSSNTKYHQIPGLLENYLMSEQKVKNQIESNYIINQSDLKKFIKSVSFDGKEFRLKSGDEYAIRVENTNLCEFEKFNYEVIFDSGKKQKFNPELTKSSSTVPVPWDTPGNIKISNHLFEFNQSSNRIIAKRTFKDRAELDILYELFVVDSDFNKFLSKDLLENKIIVEPKIEIPDWEKEGECHIKRKSIKPWLDNYKKIEYLFTFEIPSKQGEVIEFPTVNITITPSFKTNIDLVSKSEIVSKAKSATIEQRTISFDIIQDEHIARLNVDLDNIEIAEIGDTNFYWVSGSNGENCNMFVNCTRIDGYYPWYMLHNLDGSSEEWHKATISGNNDELLEVEVESNKIVAISFCYREENSFINKPDEKQWEQIPGENYYVKKQYDSVVTKVIYTYDSSKMKELWKEYCSNILEDSDESNDNITYGKRYDLIPFETIYKNHLNNLTKLSVNKIDLSSNFGIIHDTNAEEGEFYKYFEKFSKETDKNGHRILFPSIVEKAPESYTSDQCFEIPRDVTLTLDDVDLSNLGNTNSNTIKNNITVQYVDRKDIANRNSISLNLNSKNDITLWNKVKGEVQQKGDLFYFADNVEYSRLTEGGYRGRFDIVTIDQDGKKNSDFQVNCEIDGQSYTWKSLDIQNYRAIRMGYPETAHDIGESVPCRQMDFAGYGENGLTNIDTIMKAIGIGGASGAIGAGLLASGLGAASAVTGGIFVGLIGASVLAGSITALSSLQSFNKRKLTGMCNYIGNFHKHMRNHIISSGKDCLLTTLKATTFYRDKAQRPTFTVNGVDIITPDWKRWKNDECENGTIGSGKNDTRHFTNSKTYLAFRVFHDVAKDGEKPYQWGSKLNPVNPTETIEMTEDYEYWVKVSGSEQHSTPVKKGEPKKIEGIGLVGDLDANPGWYKAWINNWDKDPTNDKYYFRPHTQTEIVPGISWMAQDTSNWCGQLFFRITIPDEIYNQFEAYKLRFLESNFENLPKTQTFDFGHKDVWKKWDNSEISTYFTKLNTICEEDKNALKEHPIFKCFVNAGGKVSDRVKNWPVAGMYPNPDTNEGISGDMFDSIAINNMPPWEHMYVNGKGTVYLTNLKPENQMYVCKNNKKQVFGYFPYIAVK